jgi:hypothetical protein
MVEVAMRTAPSFRDSLSLLIVASLFICLSFYSGCVGASEVGDDDDDLDDVQSVDDDQTNDDPDDNIDDDVNDDVNDDTDDDIDDDADDDDDVDDEFAVDPPEPSNHIGVFVSIGGSDLDPGTMESPKRTIQAGVDLAERDAKVVFVSGGTFNESVESQVSMYGGYNPDDWSRDIGLYATRLRGVDMWALALGMYEAPPAPVTIDGFTVIGPVGWEYSYGVRAIHGEFILLNNDIRSGLAIGPSIALSYGVDIQSDASLKMKNNIVRGGTAMVFLDQVESVGLNFEGKDAMIADNFIYGGDIVGWYPGDSAGIYAFGSGRGVFVNNVIASGNLSTDTWGMQMKMGEDDVSLILNNYILSRGRGGSLNTFSPTVIVNNILEFQNLEWSGGAYCEQPVTLMNNNFWGQDPHAGNILDFIDSITQVNSCLWEGCVQAGGNIVAEPQFVGPFNNHLTPGSPCIDTGVDPLPWYDGVLADRDFDGDARPQGGAWDIGVDEYVFAPRTNYSQDEQ